MNNIKDIIKKDIFNYPNNHPAIFLCRKLEKITTAIYMVTEFFPDEEPLKFYLRKKSIELMSYIMSLNKGQASLSEDNFFKITSLMSEIDYSLRILLSVGFISEMNFSILEEEYRKFLEIVKQQKDDGLGRKVIFSDTFFKVDDKFSEEYQNKDLKIDESIQEELSKGHHKGQSDLNEVSFKNRNKKINILKTSVKINKTNKSKQERRDIILKFIKDKKEVSVKDITKTIKDCSEKTIQRELVSLVNSNVLNKIGERRWSKYSLKTKN